MALTQSYNLSLVLILPLPFNIIEYFIDFDDNMLQCEIVFLNNLTFTFIHRKTTPLKDEDNDLIYSTKYDARPNWRRRITVTNLDIERKIYQYFVTEKVFYQDNEVGEIVRNYLNWCSKG